MTQRLTTVITAAVAAIILAGTLWNMIRDPLAARRIELANRLKDTPAEIETAGAEPWSYAQYAWAIQRKPKVWDGLVPPPPPPPKPKPKPKRPDLAKMLQGVVPLTGQIGDKLKMNLPGERRPVWMSTGDVYQGCTLKMFDKDFAVFTYYWKEEKQMLVHKIPRK